MKKIYFFILAMLALIFLAENASAHCPLCTVGAGAAAAGAVWLGVSQVVAALFIGGFGISMGMWLSRIVKKKFIRFQSALIVISSFLLTVLPLLPILTNEHNVFPFYLSLFGAYGSFFNRTYLFDLSLLGSLLGGFLVLVSPKISLALSKIRKGKKMPFQGVLITLLMLIIAGGIIQLLA